MGCVYLFRLFFVFLFFLIVILLSISTLTRSFQASNTTQTLNQSPPPIHCSSGKILQISSQGLHLGMASRSRTSHSMLPRYELSLLHPFTRLQREIQKAVRADPSPNQTPNGHLFPSWDLRNNFRNIADSAGQPRSGLYLNLAIEEGGCNANKTIIAVCFRCEGKTK
jgi:hypothetical protein